MKSVAQSFAVGSGGPNLNSGQFSSRAFPLSISTPSICPFSWGHSEGVCHQLPQLHQLCGGTRACWDCSAYEGSAAAPGVRPVPRGLAPLCALPPALRHSSCIDAVSHTGLPAAWPRWCDLLFCPDLESVNLSVPGLSCLPVHRCLLHSVIHKYMASHTRHWVLGIRQGAITHPREAPADGSGSQGAFQAIRQNETWLLFSF